MKPTTKDVLIEARKIIVKGWTRNAYARTKTGRSVPVNDPKACRFCALGAITKASGNLLGTNSDIYDYVDFSEMATSVLYKVVKKIEGNPNKGVASFNDGSKSKKRVIDAFDQAIANCGD